MNIADELKKTELFSQLSGIALSKLAAGCLVRKIEAERMIFHEGDEGSDFFMMISGRARVFKSGPEGREITIKLIGPGEIFGEVVLFERSEYPGTCIAIENCVVIEIKKSSFLELLKDFSFSSEFFQELMKKMRYLNERILYLSAMDVEERFFRFLKDNFGVKESYRIGMSKKDAASAIGTIPETFSRMLARLKKGGQIEWESEELKVAPHVWELYEL